MTQQTISIITTGAFDNYQIVCAIQTTPEIRDSLENQWDSYVANEMAFITEQEINDFIHTVWGHRDSNDMAHHLFDTWAHNYAQKNLAAMSITIRINPEWSDELPMDWGNILLHWLEKKSITPILPKKIHLGALD